jgi:imidazolonepropionase
MNNKQWDEIWINGTLATMKAGDVPYGLITQAGMAKKNGKIAWIGKMTELKEDPQAVAEVVHDFSGKCITPGLIDCHTHLVFGGNRYNEFEMRMQGASYADIAKAGGGIRSTVKATREASEEELFNQSITRALALASEGVTTLEIKSGYGLDLETELKILRVARRIEQSLSISVKLTFLGAHAVPLEYQGKADEYIDKVCNEMIPAVKEANLADAVDVFCETIGFNLEQTERVFQAAQKAGLAIKCHAEQLSDSGSAALAAKYNALSVDHLEFLTEESIKALAKSPTVAVLLPGAFYFLREKKMPPIELLRQYKIPMAIASDCNPGTSPTTSLLLMLNMACVLFGLTPEEALIGVTRNASKALGIDTEVGTLEVGKKAEFVLWDVQHPAELPYRIGFNACIEVILAITKKLSKLWFFYKKGYKNV